MNAEMTDKDATGKAGWVFYDAECPMCSGTAKRLERLLAKHGFGLMPLQANGVEALLGKRTDALLNEMALLTADGRQFGGATAMLQVAKLFWWARWLNGLARLPHGMLVLNQAYRWVATRRCRVGGACRIPATANPAVTSMNWVVLIALPLVVGMGAWPGSPWVFMWSVAVAMGLAGKWLTYRDALRHGGSGDFTRTVGWFIGWPGLDGRAFFSRTASPPRPSRAEWLAALAKLLLGVALVWSFAPRALPHHSLLGGWLGMVGVVFVLHFGLFHLLSSAWRWAGVNAAPIMCNPLAAKSLAEFWGARWNTAFSIPARRLVLMPLARRVGLSRATALVFLLSGLLHELAISLPARGGWGLPTAYFALQAAGLAFERSVWAEHLRLNGWRARLFTLTVTALPAFWLFHPPFVERVILPMLHAFGATEGLP